MICIQPYASGSRGTAITVFYTNDHKPVLNHSIDWAGCNTSAHQRAPWLPQRFCETQERLRKPYLDDCTLGDRHCYEYRESLTVSRAIEKDEGIEAACGMRVSRGALFWASSARLAILRREKDEVSGPKEMEWKDSGFLLAK